MSDKGDVTKICVGTGIMPSPAYYYNRPTQENDPMGEGPVLRALIEMMDAPVSGGEPKAIDGTLSIMVGGKKEKPPGSLA